MKPKIFLNKVITAKIDVTPTILKKLNSSIPWFLKRHMRNQPVLQIKKKT